MNKKIKFIFLSLLFSIIPSTYVDAITSTFQVQITIAKSCTVTSGSPINFGTVSANSATVYANTAIQVNCSKSTPYTVGLTPSNSNIDGAGVMSGTINGNQDKVAYQLAKNTNGTPIWGNDSASGTNNLVASTGTGAIQSLTVYAMVTNANFTPDVYNDTVTVTVTY